MQIAVRGDVVPSNPLTRRAFAPRSLSGMGATAGDTECEQARKVAAGYGSYTMEKRRTASALYNTQCRPPAVVRPVRPRCVSNTTGQVSPPDCGPLDSVCVSCASHILRYNLDVAKSNQNKCRRDTCKYNCALNTAAGHPENCLDCDSQFPSIRASLPSCARSYGPGYVSPAAVTGTKGQVVESKGGGSYYTKTSGGPRKGDPLRSRTTNLKLLPASNIYQAVSTPATPPPASSPPASQPGEVFTSGGGGGGGGGGVDMDAGTTAGSGDGTGVDGAGWSGGFMDTIQSSLGISPVLLLALAGGAIFLISKGGK